MVKEEMNKPLFFVAIILLCIGAWPISIAVLIFALSTNDKSDKASKSDDIESLQRENEELKRQLGEKLVDDVIAKTESREGR